MIEPQAAQRRRLQEGLEKAGLRVEALDAPGELGRTQLVVLGPGVARPAQVARALRRSQPGALLLAARSRGGPSGWADGVLPLPLSPRDVALRLPELARLKTLEDGRGGEAPAAAPAGEPFLDPLTQFYAFTHFKDILFIEVKRARRQGFPLALGLVAFDPLPGGRLAPRLREQLYGGLSLAIRRSLRDTDYPIQYTPERVMLLMPHTDLAGGLVVARRVCERVARASLAFEDRVLHPTVSAGVAAVEPGRALSFGELARKAQVSLEAALARGGNRVEFFDAAAADAPEADATG